jgi:hypothetical protein
MNGGDEGIGFVDDLSVIPIESFCSIPSTGTGVGRFVSLQERRFSVEKVVK